MPGDGQDLLRVKDLSRVSSREGSLLLDNDLARLARNGAAVARKLVGVGLRKLASRDAVGEEDVELACAEEEKVSSAVGKERDRSKRTVGAVARLRAAEVGPERMSEPEVSSCGMIPASGTADAPDGTESAKATPEVAGLCTPVEGFFVQEVRHNDRVDDGDEVVGDSGESVARKGARVSSRDQTFDGDGGDSHDSLCAKTGRRDLGDDRVADRSNRSVVDGGVDEEEPADSVTEEREE